jgi:hypothetical protein
MRCQCFFVVVMMIIIIIFIIIDIVAAIVALLRPLSVRDKSLNGVVNCIMPIQSRTIKIRNIQIFIFIIILTK